MTRRQASPNAKRLGQHNISYVVFAGVASFVAGMVKKIG
jgi:hypothetical protein